MGRLVTLGSHGSWMWCWGEDFVNHAAGEFVSIVDVTPRKSSIRLSRSITSRALGGVVKSSSLAIANHMSLLFARITRRANVVNSCDLFLAKGAQICKARAGVGCEIEELGAESGVGASNSGVGGVSYRHE